MKNNDKEIEEILRRYYQKTVGSTQVQRKKYRTEATAKIKSLLNDRIIEAKIEELESLWEKVNDTEIGPRYEVDIWRERTYDRISELKAQTVRGEKE